ncbi:hypothetical protein HWN40_12655 [Methanolobus zinderi]|uniref:Uncharacterized protein n=1 Tax=Methanolobus zinderi TaxID=536044 RepID=A0A7D5EAL4_9EURY|nr:hypothetical protein [Methanolobus zinderi]QLC51015.1 hypothetical protein HWN40_12655 [Methanolobus zinderi]
MLPAEASYSWENDITVGLDGMSWTYTEQYSDSRSVLYRAFIDSELGDNDGFVSAWEVLKMDTTSRAQLLGLLEGNMDVKINGSSDAIVVTGVESDMSMESLGPVTKEDTIVNMYEVHYVFEEPIISLGDRIWFLGEPGTAVTIRLPDNIKVESTEGIDNVSIDSGDLGQEVSGDFGFTGEAVIHFEPDMVLHLEGEEDEETPVSSVESDTKSFGSLVDEIFPGFTDDFLKTVRGNSLI